MSIRHSRVTNNSRQSFVRYHLKPASSWDAPIKEHLHSRHHRRTLDFYCPNPCLPDWLVGILRAGRPLRGEVVEGQRHAVHGIVSYECDGCAICWEDFTRSCLAFMLPREVDPQPRDVPRVSAGPECAGPPDATRRGRPPLLAVAHAHAPQASRIRAQRSTQRGAHALSLGWWPAP